MAEVEEVLSSAAVVDPSHASKGADLWKHRKTILKIVFWLVRLILALWGNK